MAETQLPRQINILRETDQGSVLTGNVDIKSMPRLLEYLCDDAGSAQVDLQFGKDGKHTRFIKGHLSTALNMICQRCLKPMEFVIDDDINLSPVLSEGQAKALPIDCEPVLVDRDGQELAPIIEDELILRLPIVALHGTEECHAKIEMAETKQEATELSSFARELSKLKN